MLSNHIVAYLYRYSAVLTSKENIKISIELITTKRNGNVNDTIESELFTTQLDFGLGFKRVFTT